MSDPLRGLLELGESEKEQRGLTYTPREIFQQPETWAATYLRCTEKSREITAFLRDSGVGASGGGPTVLLIGAGTSDYIGRSLAPLLRQRWGCEVWAVPSTDLLPNLGNYLTAGRKQLWISFSRSGDSSEGVAVLRKVLESYPEVRHLVVTCNARGRMVEECSRNKERAYALVLQDAVNDRGLAMTSSFSNMVIAGQCLAHYDDLERYGGVVDDLSGAGKRLLPVGSRLALSLSHLNCAKACFVGSGALAAVASECALKVLELTAGKVHTMAESALGLRHGPMSALDRNTLFVMFLSEGELRRKYELDLLREICTKKLGKARALVAPRQAAELGGLAEHVLTLDLPSAFGDEYRPPLDVMFGQLLGLFSSVNAGLRPDHPSPNGAISRVVSHVNIYS